MSPRGATVYPALQVSTTPGADGITVIAVSGELDFSSAPRLRLALRAVLTAARRPYILLDLAGLVFMDSSGLGLVISGFKGARARGGMVVLAAMPDNTARLMRVAGLTRLLPPHATVAEAHAALSAETAASGSPACATHRPRPSHPQP